VERGDRVLLIVEDDVTFAGIMVDVARSHGTKAVVASQGGTAISLARENFSQRHYIGRPVPDMSGWTLLNQLKHEPARRTSGTHYFGA